MTIRVAVIGLGIGREHLKAYLSIPECEVVAVSDLNRDLASQVLSENGLSCPVMTFEEIVSDPRVDAVSLASYDSHHAQQVVRALQMGKHVFVEKPLCRTQAELSAIHQAWKTAKTHLRSNLVLRNAPIYSWITEALRSGDLGAVYSIDADYLYGRLQKITDGWRSHEPAYSVFAGGGVHMMDLVLRITGQRPTSVSARGNRIATEGTPFKSDDFVASTLAFDSGLIGRVNANFGCVHPHQHALRIFGTQGTFLLDDKGPRIFKRRGDEQKAAPVDVSTRYESKGVLIPDFIRAVIEGQDPREAVKGELDLMSVVVAVDQAHASGIEVQVEYLR